MIHAHTYKNPQRGVRRQKVNIRHGGRWYRWRRKNDGEKGTARWTPCRICANVDLIVELAVGVIGPADVDRPVGGTFFRWDLGNDDVSRCFHIKGENRHRNGSRVTRAGVGVVPQTILDSELQFLDLPDIERTPEDVSVVELLQPGVDLVGGVVQENPGLLDPADSIASRMGSPGDLNGVDVVLLHRDQVGRGLELEAAVGVLIPTIGGLVPAVGRLIAVDYHHTRRSVVDSRPRLNAADEGYEQGEPPRECEHRLMLQFSHQHGAAPCFWPYGRLGLPAMLDC